MDKLRGKNVTFFMQDELDEYPINLTTRNDAGEKLNSGIISQLDIANSTVYSKITEETIKEALKRLCEYDIRMDGCKALVLQKNKRH